MKVSCKNINTRADSYLNVIEHFLGHSVSYMVLCLIYLFATCVTNYLIPPVEISGLLVTPQLFRCSCGTGLDSKKLRQSGRYFLYIPMAALLRDLLEVAETEEEILRFMDQVKQTKDGNMHNVFDAIRYKKLLEVPPLYSASCHSVSMLTYKFNIDGVESCKSASNSLYPLQVMLNELPPKLANKLVLTPFLFIKSKENDMAFKQEYLKVFADDCNELSETGNLVQLMLK